MATTYQAPSSHRFHYWEEAYSGWYGYTSATTTIGSSLSSTYRLSLDKDVAGTSPYVVEVDGGTYHRFSKPVRLDGYLLDLVSGAAPEVYVSYVPGAYLNTGEWVQVEEATLTPIESFGTPYMFSTPLVGVTAIRFHYDTASSVANIHLYGEQEDEFKLKLVQPDGVTEMQHTDWNFGTGGKDGVKDLKFRIHNTHPGNVDVYFEWNTLSTISDTTTGPTLFDELFISLDGFKFISMSRANDDPGWFEFEVPAGGLSQIITLRRISYSTHDNLRLYSVPLSLNAGYDNETWEWLDGQMTRIYFGDVDTALSDIQLWGSSSYQARPGDQLTLTLAGAGDTESEFFHSIYVYAAGKTMSALTPVSWTAVSDDPLLGEDSTLVDLLDTALGIYEPRHQDVVVDVPADLSSGSYLIQVWSRSGTTEVVSDPLPLQVYSPFSEVPSTQDGYRLQATDLAGNVLSSNVPYTKLAFTDELSDVGSGKVTLNFSSPFWTTAPYSTLTPQYIAENEFIWQVYEGSVLRFSFLNSVTDDDQVNKQLSRVEEIQSEGICSTLAWSMVAPPKFPEVPPFYWTFANARLWQWLTIWAECAIRVPTGSVQKRVVPTFTRFNDSAGNIWLDPGYENQQPNGVNMLMLLQEHCDSVGADFHMRPDFQLDVKYSRSTIDSPGKYFGADRTEVVFRSNLLTSKRINRDRSEVGNWVLSQDDYGEVTLKFDAASIVRNGMRERYVEAGRSGLVTTRTSKAAEELKWYKDQAVSWTLGVFPYYEDSAGTLFNRAFVDYEVGDWIYVEDEDSGELVSVQVSAITISVESDGQVEAELTLESLAALRKRKADLLENASSSSGSGSGSSTLVLFKDDIFTPSGVFPETVYALTYLPLAESEIVTLGMKKYMEIDSHGGLAVREFTRTLRRGVHWERSGWEITILDQSVFDEAY